jgi:outer membrane lipoprotein SlyB
MRNRLIAALIFATSTTALVAVPVAAEAKQRVLVCRNVHKKATNGTVIGALGGGLLGHTVAGHGNKTGGTLIGAGVGAVAGHEIAKSNAKKKNCHYEYR